MKNVFSIMWNLQTNSCLKLHFQKVDQHTGECSECIINSQTETRALSQYKDYLSQYGNSHYKDKI